jgi:hypothetical protein
MGRYARNSAILAKIEATEGVDAAPTGAANALLVSEQTINPLNAQNVDRALVRPFFGGSEQLVGVAYKEATFTTEVAGSGAAGTAPAWGALLIACGMAETVAAGLVSYQPDTPAAARSATIHYLDDGVRHALLGARGTVQFALQVGERPTMAWSFQGRDGGDVVAAAPALTLTAWKPPVVVKAGNTVDVKFGATYADGVVAGGTAIISRGLSLDLGNVVTFTPLLSAESVDITGRAVVGSIELDLTPTQEVQFLDDVKANVVRSIAFEHGPGAGHTVGFFLPAVQLINPKKVELNGRRLIGFDLRAVPVAGNDDIVIWCK